jgi:hypothetical protein
MEVSGQLHVPASLPPGKEPLVPIGYEVGWAPEPVWTQWGREKFPAPSDQHIGVWFAANARRIIGLIPLRQVSSVQYMANILEPYFEELVEEKTFSRAFREDSCHTVLRRDTVY